MDEVRLLSINMSNSTRIISPKAIAGGLLSIDPRELSVYNLLTTSRIYVGCEVRTNNTLTCKRKKIKAVRYR